MGFKKTVAAIKKGGSAENPEAVAASIGRKKYGKEKFQKAAAAGKKLGEQGVEEGQVEESGLQAYLGKKKYGKEGMRALQKAGREGASKEKMAMIRAKHDKMDEEQLDEKAVSRAQQKFMGMVHAAKKGEKPASPEVAKVAKGMTKKAARDFAATKHKGLPKHVNEAIHKAFQNGYTKEEILESLNVILESDADYWRELTKDIPEKGATTKTVHKGHYGTEYQGDGDDDDDGQPKKKIAKPEGEKRGRGRPKGVKNRVVRAGEKKAAPTGEKRVRGRPAGSKNKVKESWIAENNQMIAEAFLHLVERQTDNRLPAPMEPTYIRDPKTGQLVPDIDYKLNPQLKPEPAKPAPRPAPKPQQGTDKRSEADTDSDVAEEIGERFKQLQEPVEVELDATDVGATHMEKEGPIPRFKELQEPVEVDLDSDPYGFEDEDAYKGRFMRSPTIDPGNLSISEMMRLAGAEEQLDEKMIIMPDGSVEDRTLKLTPDQIARINSQSQQNQQRAIDNTNFRTDVDRVKNSMYMKPGDTNVYSRERGLGPSMARQRLSDRGVDIPGLVGNRVNPATADTDVQEDDLSEMMRLAGMEGKLSGKQHKLDVDRDGDIEADDLADLRSGKSAVDEADMEEGNEFSGALAKAKASGAEEFKVDGKTYPVKESKLDECGEMGPMANGMTDQEGRMNVTTNMSTDGTKSVTVTADGDAALELMQILSLAGMQGHKQDISQADVKVIPMEEAKDERYHASTTPEEDIIPLETQLQGGDGEVAGKTKKMNKHGSARFSDNPLAVKDVAESISLSLMKEYESIKVR
jgi:hypothetical protein